MISIKYHNLIKTAGICIFLTTEGQIIGNTQHNTKLKRKVHFLGGKI